LRAPGAIVSAGSQSPNVYVCWLDDRASSEVRRRLYTSQPAPKWRQVRKGNQDRDCHPYRHSGQLAITAVIRLGVTSRDTHRSAAKEIEFEDQSGTCLGTVLRFICDAGCGRSYRRHKLRASSSELGTARRRLVSHWIMSFHTQRPYRQVSPG